MSKIRKTGGDLLAETLKNAGVEHVFALHGGHLEAFYKGCLDHGIALTDFRHEAAAGHAADGYARVTGKLGVCCVTAGPGFGNAIPAILNAFLDNIPVLFIIGATPIREVETNALQGGFDQIALARPAAKWATRVMQTERMADLTAMAIRTAMTGRKGPVVLEVPIDILHIDIDPDDAYPVGGAARPAHIVPPADLVAEALKLLAGASRPAIITGQDCNVPEAGPLLTRLAEIARVPVFAEKQGFGLIASGHELDGHEVANLARLDADERPDVVLLAGARTGLFTGGRGNRILPSGARLIQISSDPAEIGRLHEVAVPLAGDGLATLQALIDAASRLTWTDRPAWIERATALKRELAKQYPEPENERGIHPFHAAGAVIEAAGPDAIFAFDGGEAGAWCFQQLNSAHAASSMGTGYLGCLGVSPGFAIGARIAFPDRRVLMVSGDGAFGFHMQEMDTMVRHNLPIVMVILNNRVWGMSLHGQQIMYGDNYSAISRIGDTPYARIAEAFGCHAEQVTRYADLQPAMERAFATGRPALVEVMIEDVMHPITEAMLGQADDQSMITIPYYENIRRPGHES